MISELVGSGAPLSCSLRWLAGVIALLLGMLAPGGRAQADSGLTQYQVQAAFLYHFAKYVQWPSVAFSDAGEPIVIGILGDDPFGEELMNTIAREKPVQGRPLRIMRSRNLMELVHAHILFISASEDSRLAQHLATLARVRSTALTVGESEDFLKVAGGGMIRFVVEKNKVRFDINARAAESAGLILSSKLLSLARNSRGGR